MHRGFYATPASGGRGQRWGAQMYCWSDPPWATMRSSWLDQHCCLSEIPTHGDGGD